MPKVNLRTMPASRAYAAAGVDIDLGNKVKSNLPMKVRTTHRTEVLNKIGSFGGLFDASFKKYKKPVLVSSVDGVGTKLKVAIMAKRHNTIGIDLVNHCVNDIAVLGAEPIFFLDYIGTGKLEQTVFRQIIDGLVIGCRAAGCALIGGETAQLPSVYHGDDYDLVGTIVGVVDRDKIIDGSRIRTGDVLVGFPSNGLHTNGYTLARQILFGQMRMKLDDALPGTKLKVADELLKVHINYQPLLKKLSTKVDFKGLAHITGGGLLDNIPRILPKGTSAHIQLGSWPVPPIFQQLASWGMVNDLEFYKVFNMGIGMVGVVSQKDAIKLQKLAQVYQIGSILKGHGQVILR
jgi:phosphoribosylformylglycinamidine cyclo-ligase